MRALGGTGPYCLPVFPVCSTVLVVDSKKWKERKKLDMEEVELLYIAGGSGNGTNLDNFNIFKYMCTL